MTEIVPGLDVDPILLGFIDEEALPGSGVGRVAFCAGVAALLRELTPENGRLLARREELQARIDARNQGLQGRVPDRAESSGLSPRSPPSGEGRYRAGEAPGPRGRPLAAGVDLPCRLGQCS